MQNVTSTASDMTTALCSSTGELRVVARWRSRICSARKVIHISLRSVWNETVTRESKEGAKRMLREWLGGINIQCFHVSGWTCAACSFTPGASKMERRSSTDRRIAPVRGGHGPCFCP